MVLTIAAGTLAALALVQQTDTTFNVDLEDRLDVSNYAGEIIVRTWERNEVRVHARHSTQDAIEIERAQSAVRIRAASWRGWAQKFRVDVDDPERRRVRVRVPRTPRIVTYELTVPATMELDLAGPYTDVTVEGTRGEVSVRVNEGDVEVRGGAGLVAVRSMEGNVTLDGTEGKVRVTAIDGDVWIMNASGSIEAETIDGEITLDGIRSASVTATSVDGDIHYAGTVEPQGWYNFITHDGDVTLTIPRDASARVTVATFDGEISSDFAITLPERFRGRRLTFTLGSGSAQMEIEAFDGDIELRYRQ